MVICLCGPQIISNVNIELVGCTLGLYFTFFLFFFFSPPVYVLLHGLLQTGYFALTHSQRGSRRLVAQQGQGQLDRVFFRGERQREREGATSKKDFLVFRPFFVPSLVVSFSYHHTIAFALRHTYPLRHQPKEEKNEQKDKAHPSFIIHGSYSGPKQRLVCIHAKKVQSPSWIHWSLLGGCM